MTPRIHSVMVNIGRKRPPMDDEVLAKRSATVRRLLRGLIASAGFSAEVALSHLEEDEHRFIQVTITLLSQHGQGQLFDQQYGAEEIESLPKRLIEAGNAALHRFISSQRMSLSALSQLYKGVERANQDDMRIVSALQDLPGRSIRFVDASGPFTLRDQGLKRTTIDARQALVSCKIHMAGQQCAALVGTRFAAGPSDLILRPDSHLVIPRATLDPIRDELSGLAKSRRRVELAVFPAFSLVNHRVSLLYLLADGSTLQDQVAFARSAIAARQTSIRASDA